MISGADPGEPASPMEVHGGQGVQIGDHNKQVNQFNVANLHVTAGPLVRSAYLEQVKRIAPPELHDRHAELAELAAFCTQIDRGPYVCWRASAWAGKSALMSWFVLHPPPGVKVVSFFVTARYKGQDDRVAFTDAVLEQLADLLGQPIPAYLTETTREPHVLRMLTEAAEERQRQNQRLILVVDGLDEDRGVTTGPDAYSIAALLPARPDAGLRIIVAGRPDPPIPADVMDDHPLRDPGIVRVLAASHSAKVIKADMQRELKRLLKGSWAEQDLLGLVAAAGGGLSADDLAELTGISAYDIEENLHAVAGRTFTTRVSRWQPDAGPPVYVLGHEELQTSASASLGQARLKEYRERLHTWAEGYRERGWPTETPEYLLRGYFRMLHDAADIPRLIAFATDQTRHDLMLDITGGDTAALTEITDVQDVLLRLDEPDLPALARLNAHRSIIADRNNHVPSNLPTVWATVGRPERAEALAQAITDPEQRARTLASLVHTVAGADDPDWAKALAGRAEAAARAIADPDRRAQTLCALAEAALRAGALDRAKALAEQAEAAARAITSPDQRARTLSDLVKVTVKAGDLNRAEALARAITSPDQQARTLGDLAEAAAEAGDPDRAEALARAITSPDQQARTLGDLAEAAAEASDPDRAKALAGQAEAAAWAITSPDLRARTLADLVKVAVRVGDPDQAKALAVQAVTLARAISGPDWRARTLSALAEAAAGAGDPDRAEALAGQAEAAARAITDPYQRARTLGDLVESAARAGQFGRVKAVARAITDPDQQARALAILAAAGADDLDRAKAARAMTDPDRRARTLSTLAVAAAEAGDPDRAKALAGQAEAAARAITSPSQRARTLSTLAVAAAETGDPDRAKALAGQAEAAARAITSPSQRARTLSTLAVAAAETGDLNRAMTLTPAITDPNLQARTLAGVAKAGAGDPHRAEALARAITDPDRRARTLADLAKAAPDDLGWAKGLAWAITDPDRARPLADLAEATGAPDQAKALPGQAEVVARAITDPDVRARTLADLAKAAVEAGDLDWAEALARAITDPGVRARTLAILASADDPDRATMLARLGGGRSPRNHRPRRTDTDPNRPG